MKKIKSIEKNNNECVIYIDTDSVFFSVQSIIEKRYPDVDWKNTQDVANKILYITKEIQEFVNKSMDYFSKKFVNLETHKFFMKQELVAKSAFWTAKKRYAMDIVNKEGMTTDEMQVKGLDVVRSSFPKIFVTFMKGILKDILNDVDKSIIDAKISELQKNIRNTSLSDIARPTGVKDIDKYWDGSEVPFYPRPKGTPVHVKAAINYNDFIRFHNLQNKYSMIRNGEKIKWVYLRRNPWKLEEFGFRDNGEDPQEVLDFLKENVHYDKIFESELVNKLQDFYDALKWRDLPTEMNENDSKFFSF